MSASKKRNRRKRRRRQKRIIFSVLVTATIVCAADGIYFYHDYATRVYSKCVVELGGEVKAGDFLKDTSLPAEFCDKKNISTDRAGIYTVGIYSDPFTYECTLEVDDTVAPELVVKDLTRTREEAPTAEEFVEFTDDLSGDVSIYFKEEPNLNIFGQIPVTVVAEDPSGNCTEAEAVLNLVKEYDTTPPEIGGELDRTVYAGETVSYRTGVIVTDNVDTDIEVEVDSSRVDMSAVGDYTVIYTATDSMGNTASAVGNVRVIEKGSPEDEVYQMSDEVLSDIITDDMSDYDKAHAIYIWVKGNVMYSESSESGDWIKGAYDGLKKRRGDCYIIFAVSKALLTRAGIKNDDIEIIPTATRHHYWNVIDCGEGWRHFDATSRTDKEFKGFYVTDEELMAYSNIHYRSHNYDRTKYTYFNEE